MNPDEVEEQISEMFASVPIHLLNTVEGFIVILHGKNGCSINMSKDILYTSLDDKLIIITGLIQKLVDNPTELLNRLSHSGV